MTFWRIECVMIFLLQIVPIFLLLERVFEPLRELRKLRFDAFQAFILPQIPQICTDFYCVLPNFMNH
jgi:hypothetical protein